MLNICKQGNKGQRGQSTVEYIVLVTAVLSVAILFLTNKDSGLQAKLNTTMSDTSDLMTTMENRLENAAKGTATAPSDLAVTLNTVATGFNCANGSYMNGTCR